MNLWNSTLKRHTPLKRSTKALKRTAIKKSQKPIPKVTKKRAAELRLYEKAKKEMFNEDTVCQFPGCCSRLVTLHHKKGRMGKMVYNKKYFIWLCPEHHDFAELNAVAAKELNISANRLDTV